MAMNYRRWAPGHLDPVVSLNTHIVLLLAMLVRGVDYASGETELSARRLGAVESAAPLWVWGGLFMAAAFIGFIGMAYKSIDAVVVAHSTGTALYTTLATGLAWDSWRRSGDAHFPIGWVVALMGVLVAVVWAATTARDEVSLWVAGGTTVAAGLAIASVPLDAFRNAVVLLTIAVLHGLMATGNAMRWSRDEALRKRFENEPD